MSKTIIPLPEDLSEIIKEKKLMISVSGIRFHFPEAITLENILNFIHTFCLMVPNRIVIGNDGRISSPILHNFIVSILKYHNKEIYDLGTVPTPTVKAICHSLKADGGIIITASHNSQEWNGLKFLKKGGYFFELPDYIKYFELYNRKISSPKKIVNKYHQYNGIVEHIELISKLIPNVEDIIKKRYKVVIDPVNSSGIYALPDLLKFLNCEVIPLHSKGYIEFERPPEPTPDSLRKFSNLIKKTKASVGFALDPDGDRLVCGSPELGAINEEYTIGLAYLGKRITLSKKRKFVVNYSTSTILDRISLNDGHKVVRAPVGEANVVKKMLEIKSTFGGEGNGGVIDLEVPSKGRDSLSGIFLILSAMAYYNVNSIDDLMKMLPPLYMHKQKLEIDLDKKDKVLSYLRDMIQFHFKDKIDNISTEDGYYFSLRDNSWIHIRGSNTEPILRIIFEMNSRKELEETKKIFTGIKLK